MKIIIASDHNGFELKEELVNILNQKYSVEDLGPDDYDENDDYPDYAFKVCSKLDNGNLGILICGTGVGMAIASNKVKGIRCAIISNLEELKNAVEHNGINVISFASNIRLSTALEIIEKYFDLRLDKETSRHERRIQKIIDYENGEYNEL